MRLAASIPRRPVRTLLLPPLAVGLAVWAQWALFTFHYAIDGLLLFAAAGAAFAWSVLPYQRLVADRQAPAEPPAGRAVLRERGSALLAVLLFAVLAWVFSGGNRFRPETILFWVLSVGLYVWVFWERAAGEGPSLADRIRSVARREVRVPWTLVALALVVLLGAFFRYYQIASVPPEPTSDHAEKLLDIRDLLSGQYNIFFPRNTGREPLQFYLAVPFVHLFGLTHMALKVEQATMSLLAIPFVFLIGRKIAGSRFGLLAAFFLAVSKWDVAIARVGLRFPLYPLFVAMALFFLIRGLRRGSRNDFLLCGLITGVGMYGYSPFRAMALVIPLLVLVTMAFDWRGARGAKAALTYNLAVLVGAAALVFVPLGRYMLDNPGMFWFRAMSRMANAEAPLPDNPLAVLAGNVKNALLMFNWRGDIVWVNTVPFDPVLDWVSGGLFVLGVIWCLTALLRDREPLAAYLLVALFVLLLPSILSLSFPGENPSVVRTGGAGPVVALLVAAPVYLTSRQLAAAWPGLPGRVVVGFLLAVLLIVVARNNFDRYFVDYPSHFRQEAANSSEVAGVIEGFSKSVGSRESAYLKSYPHWVDHRNVAFHLGDPGWNNVLMTTEDVLRHPAPEGNRLYIIHKDDQAAVEAFRQRFPEGQLRLQPSSTPGKEFLVFFVPGSD